MSNLSNTPNSSSWVHKLKLVGSGGHNWAVAPCEPFYLMGTQTKPQGEPALTGAKNLLEHYGLESAYQKFCGRPLREELSGFLPHITGNVDVPESVDGSGLMALVERPPIMGKELLPFNDNQLDAALRLHPGPLPQEYSNLFAAAPPPPIKPSSSGQDECASVTATNSTNHRQPLLTSAPLPGPGSYPRRVRRHEVHRRGLNPSTSTALVDPTASSQPVINSTEWPKPASASSSLGEMHPPPGLIPAYQSSSINNLPSSNETLAPPPPLLMTTTTNRTSPQVLASSTVSPRGAGQRPPARPLDDIPQQQHDQMIHHHEHHHQDSLHKKKRKEKRRRKDGD